MDSAIAAFQNFIDARMPIVEVPSVPEIKLHRAGPRSGLRRWAEQAGYARSPYWAHPWSGGLALARFLLDEPDRVAGRAALDLGTGSGLVAIAAALAKASRVCAVDIDPYAIAMARRNATLNAVSVDAEVGDLTCRSPGDYDVVLAGDLFYAPGLASRAAGFLAECVAAGCLVLVGDPGRAYLPKASMEPLVSRPTPDFGIGAATLATVYRLRGSEPLLTGVRPGGSSG